MPSFETQVKLSGPVRPSEYARSSGALSITGLAVAVKRSGNADRRFARAVSDGLVAFCWIPFVAIGLLFRSDPERLIWFVSLTLLISFAHQPLTLALVYGDGRNFRLRKRLFTWSPILLVGAVVAAQHVSLTLLAIVAGLWNVEHTLMQRYGIIRIHARKVGEDQGRLEKSMLFAWMGLILVLVAADRGSGRHVERAGMRGKNRRGVEVLLDLQPVAVVLVPIVAAVAIVTTVWWLRRESRRGASGSFPKRVYVASTAALLVTILIDPVAGLLGFVGAHAVEYFVIVHRSVGDKYPNAQIDGGAPIGVALRRLGRTGFFIVYVGIVLGVVSLLNRWGNAALYTVVILTLGGMHVLYDGFIWKRPSPRPGGMLSSPRSMLTGRSVDGSVRDR